MSLILGEKNLFVGDKNEYRVFRFDGNNLFVCTIECATPQMGQDIVRQRPV